MINNQKKLPKHKLSKLLWTMDLRGYNFNDVFDYNNEPTSIIELVIIKKYPIYVITELIEIENYDITVDMNWFYLAWIKKDIYSPHDIFQQILNRTDYKGFLNKYISEYVYMNADYDFSIIIYIFHEINREKLLDMMFYKNHDQKNFIDYAHQNNFKVTLNTLKKINKNNKYFFHPEFF